MELVSFGLRERGKEGEKEMIKGRRKTAGGETGSDGGRERRGWGWRGWEERASVSTPCVKRADGNRG